MQLTTLLLNLVLAFTAFAAPLLTKRQGFVNIDGEPTDFYLDRDEHGRYIHPQDFPYYDSLPDLQCEAHINYVPRISRKKWKKECPPKILRWKIDHNVFESQEVAAEGRAQVEQDRQEHVNTCIRKPWLRGCKKTLAEDAAIRQREKEQEEAAAKRKKERKEQAAAAAAKLEKEQREKEAAEEKEQREKAAAEKEKMQKKKDAVAKRKKEKKEKKEKAAAEKKEKMQKEKDAIAKKKQEKEQERDGVEPSS